MPRGNRLLDPVPGNPIVDQMGGGVSWADAAQQRWQQYQAWVAQQRAEGIAQGLLDPETGWPTQAGLVDAARSYGNALLGSTTAPGLRAYHGSPHSFERFDLSKTGSGEGAQAFGHGLYFAENEGIARGYRDALAGQTLKFPNKAAEELFGQLPAQHRASLTTMLQNGAKPADIRASLLSLADGAQRHAEYVQGGGRPSVNYGDDYGFAAADTARQLAALKAMPRAVPAGSMYEVAIKADPASMLDWDKPLSQQSPQVQAAFGQHGIGGKLQPENGMSLGNGGKLRIENDPDFGPRYFMDLASGASYRLNESDLRNLIGATGEDLAGQAAYPLLATKLGGDAAASAALREAGIPGIRYADAGSRGKEGGTSNYVVFDDKLIDILRKYGIAGLTAAGIANPFGGAPAASDQTPQQ